ncbi:FAD/NAD(P)-binding domain-containing protein [Mycena latifolia]|nr:FAD/NAD(P)-binding domain-containing protein [Mycena latifolia]
MTPEETLAVAAQWLASPNAAQDEEAFARLFLPTRCLRDLLCFSWDFKITVGHAKIVEFLSQKSAAGGESRFARAALRDFQLETASTIGPPATFPLPGDPTAHGVSAAFTFAVASPPAKGRGFVRLVPQPDDGGWKALTLLTNLADLAGHEEPAERPVGYLEDSTWEEERARKVRETEEDTTVLIVGGGQAGLMCAARFGRMGIRALIVEKGERAIGEEIHVWLSSTVLPTPSFDPTTKRWTVTVDRAGSRTTVFPKHIVMATGNGRARIPRWPGMESFAGPLYHSDDHQGAAPFRGKKVIVVGADFVAKGAAEARPGFLYILVFAFNISIQVTMVQRGATCVISSATMDKTFFSVAFSERQTIEDADFLYHSMPPALALKLAVGGGTKRLKDLDRTLHDGLAKAGFKLTWELTPGGGEVGLLGFFLDRASSGTLMDTGCAQLIVDGKIKMKQGVEVEKLEADGMIFKDGSKIAADVIVLATGNEPIITTVVSLFGERIKEQRSKIWGLDDEGELTRCYRPTGAPGLWFAPGAFQHSRFFSKHLALQILAQELALKD